MRLLGGFALSFALSAAWASSAFAEGTSNAPYIDALRKKIDSESPARTESYTESVRQGLGDAEKSQGYSDLIRQQLIKKDAEKAAPEGPSSFTEKEKQRLGPAQNGGAIQAVHEGKSELKQTREGVIHHAAGFRYGASLNREITAAASSGVSFDSIYGAKYAPDLTFFYEYQPYHSEWFGNIGIVGSLGLSYFHGNGKFAFNMGNFGTESRTKFQFFTVPLMAGLSYRFNLLRILRPYVMAGPTIVGYAEMRNDSKKGHRGYSTGVYYSGGVSILLDWISKRSSWELYADEGIKHYYLTIDYSRLDTLTGNVDIAVSGINAGLTFEF